MTSNSKMRRSLLTAIPAAALGLGGHVALDAAVPQAGLVAAAHAQSNPCAPAAANPCAPAAANPCAPAAANPCAPAAANPCAPAAANPCAPAAAAPAANPCAPAAANPCAPASAAADQGGASNAFDVTKDWPQAPYGDVMPDIVENYLRAAPYVGTGGLVSEDGFAQLKSLGFKTIINLNTAEEGAAKEEAAAREAGLGYISLPVSTKAPTDEQVSKLAAYVADPGNYPILLHCQSANRVGAAWALYRASQGVPPMVAIEEGRTVGLKPSREAAVRERLGLDPL